MLNKVWSALYLIPLFYFSGAVAGPDIKDKYIVILKSGSAREVARASGLGIEREYSSVLNGFSARIPAQALAGLARNPHVEKIIPDQIVTRSFSQTGATWGLDRIDQRTASLDKAYNYNYTGAGVKAYVVDTGIFYGHVDFEGRASFGFDAFNDGRKGEDCQGHGTHVAGTIGSKTYGVAKKVSLVAVRVLDCNGSGSSSGVIAGLDWIGAHNVGPAVANLSLGGSKNDALNLAVKNLSLKNVAVVVAAGNSNVDACGTSPANAPEAITVGATQPNDARASFSNWGDCLDIFAPGVGITSTVIGSSTATASYSGTSMASPHVAGVFALYLEENPYLTPAELSSAVMNSGTSGVVTSSLSVNSNLVYNILDPNNISPDPSPELTAPIAPSSLSASTARRAIRLKWSDQSLNEEGFELYRSSDGINFSLNARLGAGAFSYNDRNVTTGRTYYYRIRAYNSAGSSSFSNTAMISY